MKKINLLSQESIFAAGGCGAAVQKCIDDAYSNHGWISVYIFVQTAFIPATAAAIAAACVAKNCD